MMSLLDMAHLGYERAKAICGIVVDTRQIRKGGGSYPVRILYLVETGGPGGAERVLLNLACHMGPRYHPRIALLKTGWLQSQVSALEIPSSMLTGAESGDLEVMAGLFKVVREHSIDLIHAHEFYMSVMGAAVSRLTGIPLVVTIHGKGYYAEKPRRRALYRMVAAQAAGVVTVSEDLRRFFCEATGVVLDQVRVIYNGIDPGAPSNSRRDVKLFESQGIPTDAVIIGAVGNLYPVKGHVYLIRAAQAVINREPNTRLVILGRGKEKDVLIAEAERLGIGDRVHFLGFSENVVGWLSAMDVFALPSLSEGLPLSLLEAMALGLPTVVTAVGGMPEVVRHGKTGLIVPPKDPEALANAILFMLEHLAIAKNMGAAAGRSSESTSPLPKWSPGTVTFTTRH